MRGALAAVLLTAATAHADARQTFYAADPSQWGHVTELVEPRYPARALAEGREGYVDVSGRVSAEGILEQVSYSPDTRASSVFIGALRRVIRRWRFQPALGRNCQPGTERVVNRVWFHLDGGKPRVAVSVLPRATRDAPVLAPLQREEPRAEAFDVRRAPAFVFTRIQVDPAGKVVSVEPRLPVRRGARGIREIEHEVIRALTQWKFPPGPEGSPNRFVCAALRLR